MYRALIDKWLSRKYVTADYLFSLSDTKRNGRLVYALELARASTVELETHPEMGEDYEWLMGDDCIQALSNLQRGTYSQLQDSKDFIS